MGLSTTIQLAFAIAVLLFAFKKTTTTNEELDVVSLVYGKVKSVRIQTSDGVTLPKPLLSWFSIPYAAPPIGKRRFAFPEPSLSWHDVPLNNLDYGDICLQSQPNSLPQSENCLTLSIFAPIGTTASSNLPVVIWVPGGAFNVGSGRMLNLPSMIANSPAAYIGVSINYRLGALGFLPSNLTNEANLLNVGFADQRQSFEWVQDNIASFGGDINKVTLFGESAGAHSIGYHLLHTSSTRKLFNRVIMDSGAPTARAFPDYTYPIYETQMSEFLERTKCEKNGDVAATFECLRLIDALEIQRVTSEIYKQYWQSMRWAFQPVIDYKYIKGPASESWKSGDFLKVNILTGFNSNEGSMFAPKDLETSEDFRAWWKVLLPSLTDAHLDRIEELYPKPSLPDSPYANSPVSKEFSRFVDAYGDYAYISQVQENAVSSSKFAIEGGKTYKYHFAQPTSGSPTNWGVYHFSELAFVSMVNLTGIDYQVGKAMNAYYTSFIITGDPNAIRLDESTIWPVYSTTEKYQMKLGGGGVTKVEKDDIRLEAVEYWRSIPRVLMH